MSRYYPIRHPEDAGFCWECPEAVRADFIWRDAPGELGKTPLCTRHLRGYITSEVELSTSALEAAETQLARATHRKAQALKMQMQFLSDHEGITP